MYRVKDHEGNIKCFEDIGDLILFMKENNINLIDCNYGDFYFTISI